MFTFPYITQFKYCDIKLIILKYYDIRSVHLRIHDKGIKKGRKDICYTPSPNKIKKHSNTVLISETGHMIIMDICNYLLPLSILYSFCPQQAPQCVVVLYLVGWPKHSWRVLPVGNAAWIVLQFSTHFNHRACYANRCLKGSSYLPCEVAVQLSLGRQGASPQPAQ